MPIQPCQQRGQRRGGSLANKRAPTPRCFLWQRCSRRARGKSDGFFALDKEGITLYKRRMSKDESVIGLCIEMKKEMEEGVIRSLGEGLARRGMSGGIFRKMGGIEAWKRVSVGKEEGEERREEEEEVEEKELGKEEVCMFLSRVIRGKEYGMSGKEKMSAVGLYMRLKGWDKVKEREEEVIGGELVEMLEGKKDRKKS